MERSRLHAGLLTLLLCCASAADAAECARPNVPRFADVSVDRICLRDAESARRVLGPSPGLELENSDGSERLTLIHHPGDPSGVFSEFVLEKIDGERRAPSHSYRPVYFATGAGIRIGMSEEELVSKLGPPTRAEPADRGRRLHYELESSGGSEFLVKYAMPAYEATYEFRNGALVNASFGFPYP